MQTELEIWNGQRRQHSEHMTRKEENARNGMEGGTRRHPVHVTHTGHEIRDGAMKGTSRTRNAQRRA